VPSAGLLDPRFNGIGLGSLYLGNDAEVNAVAFQPDDKVVLAGDATNDSTGNYDMAVIRLLPNGTGDPTFGNGTGFRFITFDFGGAKDDIARAVAVQPDGKIVVAGSVESTVGDFDVGAIRLNSDGTLDVGFNGSGK
jgi:uncharacterized delta-60 repeat protein